MNKTKSKDAQTVSRLQLSQSSSSSSNASKKRQIEDYTWVQCDDLDCQKWRKIPSNEAEGLNEEQWFCFMNSDPYHNSCSCVEEDYAAYDRLAKRLGYKYVMSHLTVGTVVWAKMTGYCRWPAIVSLDPTCDIYYMVDNEGHPCRYHVEYLGKIHSHAWIPSKLIELYGHKEGREKPKQVNKSSLNTGPVRKSTKRKRGFYLKTHKAGNINKNLRVYKNSPVDMAIDEAERLLPLSSEERLRKCTFHPKSNACLSKSKELGEQRIRKAPSQCKQCGQKYATKSTEKRTTVKKGTKQQICERKALSLDEKNLHNQKNKKTDINPKSSSTTEMRRVPSVNLKRDEEDLETNRSFEFSILEMKSTMLDKSKEEKFSIDVEMYKRNEKAFDHDLFRFMERCKLKIRNRPVWHNTPIGLFQLFLAVYERGGYQQVTQDWKWTAVYRELTNMGHGSAGATAKNFYKKNLYPYELYVRGGDYSSVIDKLRSRARQQNVDLVKTPTPVEETQREAEKTDGDLQEQSQESRDLEVMLEELDRCNNIFQLQEEIEETQKRLGIKMRYHEDSLSIKYSPGIATNASEFGMANLPEESAQEVPDVVISCGESSQPDVMFSCSSQSSQDNEMLLELEALENEFDVMDNQLFDLS